MLVSPVIPGLTDHELPAILEAAAGAGAGWAGEVELAVRGGPTERLFGADGGTPPWEEG